MVHTDSQSSQALDAGCTNPQLHPVSGAGHRVTAGLGRDLFCPPVLKLGFAGLQKLCEWKNFPLCL